MTEATKIPVLAVVGPTASGKTAAGVMLSQCYHGEVVSADSMQIYEGLDIATAKPTPEEMCGIPHHLIGCVPMDANFSVADYLALAKPVIADIHRRGKLPVLVGGAGMYVSSLLSNVQLAPTRQDARLRAEFQQYAAAHGNEALHQKLAQLDPEAAAAIH
ncbi:tRNA (adenosine(37)-N6)-dimethylallyltransferase, partial [Ruminococcus sp. CAG:330]